MIKYVYLLLIFASSVGFSAQSFEKGFSGRWIGAGQSVFIMPGSPNEISDCKELNLNILSSDQEFTMGPNWRKCGSDEELFLPEAQLTNQSGQWTSTDPEKSWVLEYNPSDHSLLLTLTQSVWTDEIVMILKSPDLIIYDWKMTKAGSIWEDHIRGELRKSDVLSTVP